MTSPSSSEASNSRSAVAGLQARLGIEFRNAGLLRTALTHPSYSNEHHDEAPETNERLEFLGDAVLGLIVAETLYTRYMELEEGRLTEWRAQIVCGPTLARVAEQMGLGEALLLGRGEEGTGGRTREGNLERVFEAVTGAVMLDQGLDAARAFAARALANEFAALEADADTLNPKGTLQQMVQGIFGRPHYVTTLEEGPDHNRWYTIDVRIEGETFGTGSGHTKQQAEKEAARAAIEIARTRIEARTGQV